MRFQRVSMQIAGEVAQGSGSGTRLVRFQRFRCKYLVRFWRVPMQIPGEVPEGSGADSR